MPGEGTAAPVRGQAIDIENLTSAELAALGDVVIVLTDGGRAGAAWIRGHKAPYAVTIDYGERGDPAQSIRHVSLRVGWTRAVWRRSPAEDRAAVGEGTTLWQRLRGHRAEAQR